MFSLLNINECSAVDGPPEEVISNVIRAPIFSFQGNKICVMEEVNLNMMIVPFVFGVSKATRTTSGRSGKLSFQNLLWNKSQNWIFRTMSFRVHEEMKLVKIFKEEQIW